MFADIKGFIVKTDQLPESGGEGLFAEPFMLFLASLGTCAGIYVKTFCDKRGLSTDQIKLTQELKYDSEKRMIGTFYINIHVPSDFPEKYENAVIRAASQCPVKKHLHSDIELVTKVLRS